MSLQLVMKCMRHDVPLPFQAVQFYKAWDAYGALSNFSCHPIRLPEGPLTNASTSQDADRAHDLREWQSVEHYYQAQKFATTSGEI